MAKRATKEAVSETSKDKVKKRRGQVTLFPNWCKDCAICVEFCPKDVLELGENGQVVIARPEECNACRWCELHCPDFAIFVTQIDPEDEG
jgi:2-oxoglutarate ferredoxin oxidoreductase subunit delta